MQIVVDLINASGDRAVPRAPSFRRWAEAALRLVEEDAAEASVAIRLVSEAESAQLNESYRGKRGSTNILSFPAAALPALPFGAGELPPRPLGDLAICVPVLKREAKAQGKTEQAHWAHLTVHGLLHLLGHDHERDDEAAVMEALEIRILAELGFADPYSCP